MDTNRKEDQQQQNASGTPKENWPQNQGSSAERPATGDEGMNSEMQNTSTTTGTGTDTGLDESDDE